MQQGAYISGMAHGALILWALFAGYFMRAGESLPIETMDVSVLSEQEFAILMAPELPQPEITSQAPQATPPPSEEQLATSTPEPDVAPQAAPEVQDVPEQPVIIDADRVAPDVAPEPPLETQIAPQVAPEIVPAETGEIVSDETPATAPEAAAPEIVTEADKPNSAAPLKSMRPTARPRTFTQSPTPEPTDEPTDATPSEPAQSDAIADALAAAQSDTPAPVPSGPPLSRGEKDALRVSVQKCWNVGALSSEALATTVVIFVTMTPDGKPDVSSIRMLSFEGGSASAAKQAYEAGRRAIIRCGASGFDLPREKFSQWREIEMIFNPNNMRIK